jgi:hypothetical protein
MEYPGFFHKLVDMAEGLISLTMLRSFAEKHIFKNPLYVGLLQAGCKVKTV